MKLIGILHVVDKFGVSGSSVSGVTKLFHWWVPRFNSDRFQVWLIGLRAFDVSAHELENAGIVPKCLGRGKYDARTISDLVSFIRSKNIKIVHLHGYGSANFGRLAACLTGVHCVIHEHFVDPAIPTHQKIVDWLLKFKLDAAVAVSKSVKDFMIDQRSIAAEKTKVIYNGAPLEDFQTLETEQKIAVQSEYGITADDIVLGTIGRLDTQKGLRYLLEALPTVLKKYPNIKLIIIGDGPLGDELKQQAANLNLSDSVLFPGFMADIRPLQSIFDMQVFPSLWEGTPLTLFEAMAMGRAIVSTNVDGLGEILMHARNAWVTEPRNVNGLANGIMRLIENPELRQQLADKARIDSADYDISTTVANLEKVYDDVLANHNR